MRRDPPPRARVVILPRLLRPAWFCFLEMRDFSGFLVVISSKEARTAFRVPGVIGRKFLSGMRLPLEPFDQVDAVSLPEGDHRLLDVGLFRHARAVAFALAP